MRKSVRIYALSSLQLFFTNIRTQPGLSSGESLGLEWSQAVSSDVPVSLEQTRVDVRLLG
jgi:hypothetical protein